MFRLREGARRPEVGVLGAFGSRGSGAGSRGAPSPTQAPAAFEDGWLVRSFELPEERSRSPLPPPPPRVPLPPSSPKAPWSLGARLSFGLSAELPSRPSRSLLCFLSVLLGLPPLPRLRFSPWVRSRGRLGPHLPFLCPVPFPPHSEDLRRLPQFGAWPSLVPEVLGGRTVPNSLRFLPPVAEEHGASGTARLGTSAFWGSVSLR